MIETINRSQIILDSNLNEISEYFQNKLPVEFSHLKNCQEQLFDLIRLFGSQFLNLKQNQACSNELSMTFNMHQQQQTRFQAKHKLATFSSAGNLFSLSNTAHQLSSSKTVGDANMVKLSMFEQHLGYEAHYKSKCFLFSKAIRRFNELNKKINYMKSVIKNGDDYSSWTDRASTIQLFDECSSVLDSCKQGDDSIINAYQDKIKTRRAESNEQYKFLEKIENLLSMWWEQPGANQCVLDSYFVNAKTLDYYIEAFDQAILKIEKKNNFFHRN
jgi:hypothetical protein